MNIYDKEMADWVEKHPYLKNIADFQNALAVRCREELFKEEQNGDHTMFDWDFAVRELKRGIPALRAGVMTDEMVEQVGRIFMKISDLMIDFGFSDEMRYQARKMQIFFFDNRDILHEYIQEILRGDELTAAEFVSVHRGIVTFLVWNTLEFVLEPLKMRMGHSLAEVGWNRTYCPVCGQLPSMAQIAQESNGEARILVCGCCKMQWTYRRNHCPFCQSANDQKLKIITLADESEFCIEICDQCQGYLKTYTHSGVEHIALNDWSTLHLDMIAKNNGYKRIGYQLYEV